MSESTKYPLVPLSEVLVQDKEYITELEPRLYPKLSVKLYGKGVVLDEPADGAAVRMKRHQLAKPGQVILSEIWAKRGAIGIVPDEGKGALVTSHFFLFDIDESRLLRSYMRWLLTANYFEPVLGEKARGTTGYAAVRPKHFLACKIPLPPPDEQRRIVTRIEELAALIEEARGLRVKAREEAAAFVTSLHLKLAQERIVGLDEILELDECREAVQPGRKYPQIGIKGFGQGLFAKEELDATQTSYKAFNRLYEGAVVLSQPKGWEGAIAVCPAELAGRYASPEYRTFRCISDKAIPEYLAAVFATPWFWTRLKNLSRGIGARRQRTRPEQFLAMEVPMPTVDQQKQAISIFRDLHELTALQDATQAELDALLPSVLDRAFKGEL